MIRAAQSSDCVDLYHARGEKWAVIYSPIEKIRCSICTMIVTHRLSIYVAELSTSKS